MKKLVITEDRNKTDFLFRELKKFVDSWGDFKNLKTIDDKVYYSLFSSFYENGINKTIISCSYPEAHAIYRLLKVILQKESNDNFEKFAEKEGLEINNGTWCYKESGQEFDFDSDFKIEKNKKEKILLYFLNQFQDFLIK